MSQTEETRPGGNGTGSQMNYSTCDLEGSAVPSVVSRHGTQRANACSPVDLPVERAHEFSVGLPASALAGADRRALVALWADAEAVMAQMATRFVQQLVTEALPSTWLRRAMVFEAVGTASADESARACRRHAWLLALDPPADVATEVASLLGEVA